MVRSALAVVLAAAPALAEPAIDVLLRTGDPAPDLSGGTFKQFFPGKLSNGGHLFFAAEIQGAAYPSGPTAWFTGTLAGLRLVALANSTPAPGFPAGTRLTSVSSAAVLDHDGSLAFSASLSDGGAAVYMLDDAAMALVTAHGQAAPGLAGRTIIDITGIWHLADHVLVMANTTTGGSQRSQVVLLWHAGVLTAVAFENMPVPQFGAGVTLREPRAQGLDSLGRAMVSFRLAGPGINLSNDYALAFLDQAGQITVLAREGQPVPGFPPGAVANDFGFSDAVSTDQGAPAYSVVTAGGGVVEANRRGLVLGESLIVRTDNQAPGLPNGARIANASSPMSAGSRLTWTAGLTGTGVGSSNNSAVYIDSAPIFREGDPAAAAPVGAVYADPATLNAINDHGDWVKQITVIGGGLPAGTSILYYGLGSESPSPLVRAGDSFAFSAEQTKTISGWRIGSGINEGGRAGPLNDSRDLLFSLTFNDLTQALVIARLDSAASPPCPSDFNGDGFRNPDDLADFITCFFLDVQFPGFCPAADFNTDGFRNPDDLADFITTFFVVPC